VRRFERELLVRGRLHFIHPDRRERHEFGRVEYAQPEPHYEQAF
jgi:hypothetical protein